ncbi:hypothetical protein ebA1110 [Aromatoleum aromaticum EbN1]|uniref:Uncharacterized protein n=1 Tax=Aromatoleum aromaticum (strain DSM 19018 / LMG 30748 / EbN1) TaxID=76114 RepID=Q5P7K5_AROAE|nr:hypothetical protein ebA1110 [Aromatoleum aromaticum EbN1]
MRRAAVDDDHPDAVGIRVRADRARRLRCTPYIRDRGRGQVGSIQGAPERDPGPVGERQPFDRIVEQHIHSGGVVIATLVAEVRAGHGAGNFPAPFEHRRFRRVDVERLGERRCGGVRADPQDGPAVVLDEVEAVLPFDSRQRLVSPRSGRRRAVFGRRERRRRLRQHRRREDFRGKCQQTRCDDHPPAVRKAAAKP